jgi:ribonuclease Z
LAVYTHIAIPPLDPTIPLPRIDDIISETKKNYTGHLEAGEDLMTIEIGDTISVQRKTK